MWGSTREEGFDISISSNALIGVFKDYIKEDEPIFKNVDKSRISLFRIFWLEDNLQESLNIINASHLLELKKALPIYYYFLCMPVLKQLLIVVQVYSRNNSGSIYHFIELNFTELWITGSTNLPQSVHYIPTGENAIQLVQESFLAHTNNYFSKGKSSKQSQSPSETSYSSLFRKWQEDPKTQIACGHPW
jgi:hypothetical protein